MVRNQSRPALRTQPRAGGSKPTNQILKTAFTDLVTAGEAASWACLEVDPEVFFPTTEQDLVLAEATCWSCLSRARCLGRGQESLSDGVWGGQLLSRGKATSTLFAVERGPMAASTLFAVERGPMAASA